MNKKDWVENSDYWIQFTKNIEDNLSDKLHEELTRSFIDKKISILSRGLKQDLREIKNDKEFVTKREEILSMIWDMEEEIMGKETG